MYRWTQKYVGIPFVSGGRTINGCDCYGLIRLVLINEYGCNLPCLNAGYSNANNAKETLPLFAQNAALILGERIETPEEKAIALIKTRGGLLTHVGIYAGDGFILHARTKTGTVCERITSPTLAGRIEGWYRVSKAYNSTQSIFCGTQN